MKNLIDHLSQYATYHRDRRNIATHFIGIPMIVAAISLLLSRPVLVASIPWLTPSCIVSVLATLYYLKLDVRYGLVLGAFLGACVAWGTALAYLSTAVWAQLGLGLFVVGWVFQFIGHWFEGRKPAFVDDIVGLLIGPLFVAAEMGFLLGLRQDVADAVTARAGQTR
ncbi:MAG: DUF962 domain-containing protein [Aquabacterium sp.]